VAKKSKVGAQLIKRAQENSRLKKCALAERFQKTRLKARFLNRRVKQ
jgi:hypothetical protein